jgi:L-asparaginase
LEQLQVEKTISMDGRAEIDARKVVILGTGGTIAGRAVTSSDNVGYVAGQVGVEQLVA